MILTADPVAAQRYAVEVTRRHGTFVVVAQPETVSVSFRDFVFRDLTVIGSLQGDVHDLEETIAVAAEHGIVSDVSSYTLAGKEALLATVHDEKRKGKAVMVF
jgi:propanol-preferring alcohol dehydrogenase